jgi:hypothetical protein
MRGQGTSGVDPELSAANGSYGATHYGGASVPLRKRQAQLKRKALEFPDDPNGQQAGISTGGIESFILAAHGK